MVITRAGTNKVLVRIAHMEDPDQTASLSGFALFVYSFLQENKCSEF